MRMTKKITSIVLAVMLVASMLVVGTVAASAATAISSASDLYWACWDGGEYELTKDITLDFWGNNFVCEDTIIHGNGYTISASDTTGQKVNGSPIATQNFFKYRTNTHADLTLDNVVLDGKGIAICAVDDQCPSSLVANNNDNDDCVITMTGCTVKNFTGFSYVGAVYIFAYSDGVFTDCTFSGNSTPENGNGNDNGSDIWAGAATSITITGCTFGGNVFANADSGSQSSVTVTDSSVNNLILEDGANGNNASATITNSAVNVQCNADDSNVVTVTDTNSAVNVVNNSTGTPTADTTRSSNVITTAAKLKAAAAAGGNWVLGNDINITDDAFTDVIYKSGNTDTVKRVAVDNDFVLNGAGYTLKVAADVYTIFGLNNATADITLSNVKIDGDHKAAWAVCSYTANGGNNSGNTINLNNVEICNFDSVSDAGAVCVFGSATANLTECNIHDNTASGTEYEGTSVWGGASSKINVNGGSYEGLYINGGTGAITVDGNADVDIIRVGTDNAGNYRVTIGTATVGEIAPDGDAVVPEGAIQVSPSASYDTDNYEVVNGYLVSKPTVAKTGGKNYGSLKSAVESAAAGATVTVTADNAVNDVIYITKDVTINATNKTIDGAVFYYKTNTAKLTLNGGIYDGKGVDDNFIWTCAVAQPDGSAADGTYRNANAGTIVTMIGTTVENYDGYLYTGAVYLFSHATGNFTNCTFRNNSTPDVDEDGFRGSDIWGGAATTINIHGGSFGDVVFVNGGSAKLTADNYAQIHQVDLFAVKGEANKFITANNATITTLNALNTKIDGYQKKTVKSGESTDAEGNDINTKGVRIIVQADKNFLDTCSDYGFVVAKYSGNKAQADLDFSVLNTTSGNGQKVISCKDSVNSGLGLDENYVTLAVNNMSAGNKVVVRFYYVKDNVTHYSTYSSYDGILATF